MNNTKHLICFIFLLMSFGWPQFSSAAIGDGPRAYLPPPVNSNVFTVYGMHVTGNSVIFSDLVTPNISVTADLGVLQYTRTMDLFDNYFAFTIVQPFGEVSSELDLGLGLSPIFNQELKDTSKGLGDTQLLLTFGLYNLPPLQKADYISFKPSFSTGGLVRLTLPTGEYSQTSQVNVGANRYTLQLGVPMTYAIADSFVDPRLTTFDLLPSVTFFKDNNDPFNAASSSQEVLYKLEAHLTHNINAGLWGSLDMVYTYGGETDIDGVQQDNKQRSLGVGVSAGVQLSQHFGIKASYGKIVDKNQNGMDGELARITLTYTQF